MNAPLAHPLDGAALPTPDLPEFFAGLCETRARFVADGALMVCEAADELQAIAKLSGLVDRIGQDAVQDIMHRAFVTVDFLDDEAEAFEREIYLRTAELVQRWELDDPRDRWRHTGEPPPKPPTPPPRRREPYRPPEATESAFWFVAGLDDPDYLAAWLARHPADAPHLLQIWKARQCNPTR
jgi:hypothetical protein